MKSNKTEQKTEYDTYLELFRSILLVNPTVDPVLDPTLNPAIDPQLNKNKSELDKANFIRCLIVATIIEKYRDKARNSLKHEKEKDVEINNFLLKHRAFRHLLEELEEEDDEEIEKKIKALIYKKTHPDTNAGIFDIGAINNINKTLAALVSAAHDKPDNKPTKPHP